jgi:hypothetical protein
MPERMPAYVAQLTGSKDSEWAPASGAFRAGDHLRKGQHLELTKGVVEITFDSGARIVLNAPASLDINSAWDSTLRRGTLTANVPHEAIGFRVSNSAVDVVDLGTEFTMIAEPGGSAEVLVLKGEIEAAPRAGADQDTILLRQNESRRFASSGISDVADSDRKFALFNQPIALNRVASTTSYVHWSFDEAGGEWLKADGTVVARNEGFDAHLDGFSPDDDLADMRTQGRHERALEFNGRLFARAAFPGLSGSAAHTVAFWVKVPEDAQLSHAYAMVAWNSNLKKLGWRPVHINWNRNPADGPIGALRTDFGGGNAMGMTSLRDGRWHHVTVVFNPGDDDSSAPQVKQYVDGRLESSTIVPGKIRGPVGTPASPLNDALWIGCRLGRSNPMQERFLGELDELFIADRGLEPNEIVALMRDNQPPAGTMVAGGPKPRPIGE